MTNNSTDRTLYFDSSDRVMTHQTYEPKPQRLKKIEAEYRIETKKTNLNEILSPNNPILLSELAYYMVSHHIKSIVLDKSKVYFDLDVWHFAVYDACRQLGYDFSNYQPYTLIYPLQVDYRIYDSLSDR